jgi:hypothetical protein
MSAIFACSKRIVLCGLCGFARDGRGGCGPDLLILLSESRNVTARQFFRDLELIWRNMDRAFSPCLSLGTHTWGVAPGWYGLRLWRNGSRSWRSWPNLHGQVCKFALYRRERSSLCPPGESPSWDDYSADLLASGFHLRAGGRFPKGFLLPLNLSKVPAGLPGFAEKPPDFPKGFLPAGPLDFPA